MCLADGATQALGGLRDNDQVSIIGIKQYAQLATCSARQNCAMISR